MLCFTPMERLRYHSQASFGTALRKEQVSTIFTLDANGMGYKSLIHSHSNVSLDHFKIVQTKMDTLRNVIIRKSNKSNE